VKPYEKAATPTFKADENKVSSMIKKIQEQLLGTGYYLLALPAFISHFKALWVAHQLM
jgi:hypothetical protein